MMQLYRELPVAVTLRESLLELVAPDRLCLGLCWFFLVGWSVGLFATACAHHFSCTSARAFDALVKAWRNPFTKSNGESYLWEVLLLCCVQCVHWCHTFRDHLFITWWIQGASQFPQAFSKQCGYPVWKQAPTQCYILHHFCCTSVSFSFTQRPLLLFVLCSVSIHSNDCLRTSQFVLRIWSIRSFFLLFGAQSFFFPGRFFVGYGLELSRLVPLTIYHLKRKYLCKTEKEVEEAWAPGPLTYETLVPNDMLIVTITLCYSVISPIILIFGLLYFGIGWLVLRNQVWSVFPSCAVLVLTCPIIFWG